MNVRFMNLGMLVYESWDLKLCKSKFISGHNLDFVDCNEHEILFHFTS